MNVLGIWDGHNASAALVSPDGILAAISEERLTRNKMQRGFPHRAIAAVLEATGTRPDQLDAIALPGCFGRAPLRLLDGPYSRQPRGQGPMGTATRLYRHVENGLAFLPGLRSAERALGLAAVRRRLAALGLDAARLATGNTVPHHLAHAACAGAMIAGPALLITMDGYGDGAWATISTQSRPGHITQRASRNYLDSVAVTYGSVCQALGFREGDEGKVTALAAAGDPETLAPFFRKRLRRPVWQGGGGPLLPHDLRLLAAHPPQAVAAGLQRAVEEWVLAWLRPHVERYPGLPLVAAGGLFANVSLNRTLLEAFPDRDVLVFPAMGDTGLSLGAALALLARRGLPPPPFCTALLGPDLAPADARPPAGWCVAPGPHPARAAAQVLASGGTVARVAGRDEFGPRALGNRSLFFRADSPALADAVQDKLQRSRIMPFAPICCAEDVPRLFAPPYPAPAAPDFGLGHMTVAIRARAGVAEQYPVAIHVDGTARVQAVSATAHPEVHALLQAWRETTGQRLLINTSFNHHNEPIVHSRQDALDTAARARIDRLWLDQALLLPVREEP